MKNNFGNKTLEEIENDFWSEPEYDSYLVTTIHKLRKKKIADFDVEDLRIMIGQNRGLATLIPIAIDRLRENILAEGDYYEGDLLKSTLTSDQNFWNTHTDLKKQVIMLFEDNIALLKEFETTNIIRKEIFEAFFLFSK